MEIIINLDRFLTILFAACLVAIVARRLRIPYTVGLVLAGIMLSFVPLFKDLPFSKDLIFNVFLPPLVFEAAIQIHWEKLRREIPLLFILVTLGLCLSAATTALGMHYLLNWTWISALLFGALISATDPVSVIATFKESGGHSRFRLLVEAESLLNDGTAAVAYAVVLAAASGPAMGLSGIAEKLALTIAGGVICGTLVAGLIVLLAGQSKDHLVNFTLTTLAAYASFLLAEHFHFSGVLSSLTAGLLIGNLGFRKKTNEQEREIITAYWDYLAFIANSFLFIGIGVHESFQNNSMVVWPAILAILLVLLGRFFAIYPCCALFARSQLHVPGKQQFVLFWGGLRGALALALALGLPAEIAHREEIISVTFAVVAFSIFVQGLTMTPLLRRTGEIP